MGSLKENAAGIQEVQDDFYLATAADIVADPSAPSAFVQGIMEGKEWIWANGMLTEATIVPMQKAFQKKMPTEREMMESFDLFMRKLSVAKL